MTSLRRTERAARKADGGRQETSRFKKHANQAQAFSGNAVVAVDIDYESIGIKQDGNMLMVSTSGTAVLVKD